MPAGRYTVMDGDGHPVGTEDFRCAPGPLGWRYFADIATSDPQPHTEVVDLAVDADWRAVRTRISTGSHEILLVREGDTLTGFRDGQALELSFGSLIHLDYLSPAYNAVTTRRLAGTAEIDVVYLDPVTVRPRPERQRYEDLGEVEVDTPVGRFTARRWGFTALGSGWSTDLWVAGDVVVRFDGLYELEWYEAGASGPRPLT
ncbi:MAG TPA: hypothetical protein VFT27_02600 [Actinomycetota bacterium]|nr:hypothetical protein [Actinomycetota bacterium]